MIYDCIEYIAKKQKKNMKTLDIAILVNDNNQLNIDNIIELSKSVKFINIVTNNINRFKKLENLLTEKYGIIIKVSNNMRKNLAKVPIILNIDFEEETLNKYNINKHAIILNINNKNKIYLKKFVGINVNFLQIYFPKKYETSLKEYNIYGNFDDVILYESLIYSKDSYMNIKSKIRQDKFKLKGLVGNNGKIRDTEYISENVLTKVK